jgi:hypothetical protein
VCNILLSDFLLSELLLALEFSVSVSLTGVLTTDCSLQWVIKTAVFKNDRTGPRFGFVIRITHCIGEICKLSVLFIPS